jgi:hypothetical protein
VPNHDEDDVLHTVVGIADSLLGLADSWEHRQADEIISSRSRRMLVADLGDVIKMLPDDTELIEFATELSTLRDTLTYGDGAEQVKWIAKRLCSAYGVDSRTLKPRRRNFSAKDPHKFQRVTAPINPADNGKNGAARRER